MWSCRDWKRCQHKVAMVAVVVANFFCPQPRTDVRGHTKGVEGAAVFYPGVRATSCQIGTISPVLADRWIACPVLKDRRRITLKKIQPVPLHPDLLYSARITCLQTGNTSPPRPVPRKKVHGNSIGAKKRALGRTGPDATFLSLEGKGKLKQGTGQVVSNKEHSPSPTCSCWGAVGCTVRLRTCPLFHFFFLSSCSVD